MQALDLRWSGIGMQEQSRFAAWLAEEMRERSLSARRMALMLGVSPNTVSGWLNKGTVPDQATLERIAPRLGLQPDELYTIAYGNGGEWTPRRKTDGDLTLALVPPVARALMRHRATQPAGDLIFTRPDGRAWTQQQAYDVFRRRVRGSGLPFRTPHDMRHANNSLADALGVDLGTRMEVLGHRSAEVNRIYSHTNPERARAALERIAAAIGG